MARWTARTIAPGATAEDSQPPSADAPTLHVDAVSIFGGVSIEHDG